MTNLYTWVRFRTRHAASVGDWQWREFNLEGAKSSSLKDLQEFFGKHFAEGLADELNTHGEGYRGIDYEVLPAPVSVINAQIDRHVAEVNWRKAAIFRLVEQRAQAFAQQPNPNKRCRDFPRCGCLVEFKTKDCRPPHEEVMARIREATR